MCGRMNVIAAPLTAYLGEQLGIQFKTQDNTDLRPTQRIDTLMWNQTTESIQQVPTRWGIQPTWATKLLINAQVETAAVKPTFKRAFTQSRCMIPVSGYYEWRTEEGRKVKYLFESSHNSPLFMGGLVFHGQQHPELVSLTIAPNETCAEYHHRMPFFVSIDDIDYWFTSPVEQLEPLLQPLPDSAIKVSQAE
ncbi:DUF159 family protein [Pseudidiomarina aestuarii]|uniref:Abasic site processing protein n=1 Tax=Pseudidiomarina aestuarii TaxID=624146 RepID=A0A2T4D9E4_9GAMM|nr:DUF159 family protein [Pseudidiomarina aestuarii]PTB90488.1 DUF159 family protein [Pseudidiomarina aestuarii]